VATSSRRLDLLADGFAARQEDPLRAAQLLSDAGVGTILERVRFEAWLDALEHGNGKAALWREYLNARPPDDLASRARLGLARALAKQGQVTEVAAVLEDLPGNARNAADEVLLTLGLENLSDSAARRLAVEAPHRLRSIAPDLERQLVPTLTVEERLVRSVRWRDFGHPRTSAGELRALEWKGSDERRRRMEVARSDVEAGSPSRALRVLPSVSRSSVEELIIRAQAHRRRAWQRTPSGSARSAFVDCLEVASRAVEVADSDDPARLDGFSLIVECGTEADALEGALEAWSALEAMGWSNSQRRWLGRRLGVALARERGDADVVRDLASALPSHTRCIRFWSVESDPDSHPELVRLASEPVSDIYGQWARQQLEVAGPSTVDFGSPVQAGSPPPAVLWLLDQDAESAAAREWRRILSTRDHSPAEALAAAELANSRERNNETIRWLRVAYPELGTVEIWRAPSNVVRAYVLHEVPSGYSRYCLQRPAGMDGP
jgi:hypothetical protein